MKSMENRKVDFTGGLGGALSVMFVIRPSNWNACFHPAAAQPGTEIFNLPAVTTSGTTQKTLFAGRKRDGRVPPHPGGRSALLRCPPVGEGGPQQQQQQQQEGTRDEQTLAENREERGEAERRGGGGGGLPLSGSGTRGAGAGADPRLLQVR